MSLRIVCLLALVATLATAFSPERMDSHTENLGAVPYKYYCKYRVSQVWNDIFFLVDSTGTYGDFTQLFYTMNQILDPFTTTALSGTREFTVRFGAAFFNRQTAVVGLFADLSKSQLLHLDTLQYYDPNDTSPNIDQAFSWAERELNKSNRPTAKKVVVVLTSQNSYNSTYAQKLKDKGFIIMVHQLKSPCSINITTNLPNIASPGYYTNSVTNTVEDIQNLQATANCFCNPSSQSFTQDSPYNNPTGGCYSQPPKNAPTANYPLGVSQCSSSVHGIVALDKTQQKNTFLNSAVNGTYYIGLKYNEDYDMWLWEDGSSLSTGDFNGFPNSRIPAYDGTNGCVIQDSTKSVWTVTNCRNSYKYLCEAGPCDTTNYCY